jgi:predicted nucleotidyltransferase
MDFKDEYQYLIHLVKAAIHDTQPEEKPSHLSFGKVYCCGVEHEVANIAFYSIQKLRNKPGEKLFAEWETCCNMAVARDFNQSFAREEILAEFEKSGIRSLEVQGTVIKQFYPRPEYRTMSDIDFIIDLSNLSAAREILESLGYTCKDMNGVEVDGFRSPNIHIEVHTEYFPESSQYHNIMRLPFASVEETGSYDPNEFYIYNMLHIAKHYFYKGCGIRRILDAYCINKNYGELLNRAYVNAVFERAEAVDFLEKVSLLAECWFGEGERDARIDRMEDYMLHAGVHGNEQNGMNIRLKEMYADGTPMYRLRYYIKRLFPGNEVMYVHYPFLERWKVLYPFCWIHRILRMLFSEDKHRILGEMKRVADSDLKENY